MNTNRILFSFLFMCCIVLGWAYTSTYLKTGAKGQEFRPVMESEVVQGKLYSMTVMNYDKQRGYARIFMVETLPLDQTEKKQNPGSVNKQIGKMVELQAKGGDWSPIREEIYWDDTKKTGNKFTFPPLTGWNKAILLTK